MERAGDGVLLGHLPSGDSQGAAEAPTAEKKTSSKYALSQSLPHQEIAKQMKKRAASGRIFGETWKSFFGFFAPFGTDNCFWERLKNSPSFQHLFLFDGKAVDNLHGTPLTEEVSGASVTVNDVDAAVNTCSLVCALLLSVPCTVMSSVGGSHDFWQAIMQGGVFEGVEGVACELPYSDYCLKNLKISFEFMYRSNMICFYASLCTLVTAVFYYMCRPSESCNSSSISTLFEAFTLEVRHKIRKERLKNDTNGSEVSPEVPFDSPIEEIEVFMKAKFLAMNELEEQKNQV